MEVLTVVDSNDKVVGSAPFDEVYEKKLIHRLVHVLVFNSKGDMLLHKRAKDKSFCGGYWNSSAGGHVRDGEEYEDAASRELKEELGVDCNLDFFSKELYVDKEMQIGLTKFMEIYKCVCEGPFDIDSNEVEKVEFCSIKKIRRMIESGERFTPELRMILRGYFKVDC
jgi:isopentenyl-diphosphate delta-isomerase type 1